jgi:hypothetical protein
VLELVDDGWDHLDHEAHPLEDAEHLV